MIGALQTIPSDYILSVEKPTKINSLLISSGACFISLPRNNRNMHVKTIPLVCLVISFKDMKQVLSLMEAVHDTRQI